MDSKTQETIPLPAAGIYSDLLQIGNNLDTTSIALDADVQNKLDATTLTQALTDLRTAAFNRKQSAILFAKCLGYSDAAKMKEFQICCAALAYFGGGYHYLAKIASKRKCDSLLAFCHYWTQVKNRGQSAQTEYLNRFKAYKFLTPEQIPIRSAVRYGEYIMLATCDAAFSIREVNLGRGCTWADKMITMPFLGEFWLWASDFKYYNKWGFLATAE